MYEIEIRGKKAYVFSESIEGGALSQFYDAMAQDYVIKGALLPDAHQGYTLPIGAVVATEGVVVPAYVGYDIGCGVAAIMTDFDVDDVRNNVDAIYDSIVQAVPVGFNTHSAPVVDMHANIQLTCTKELTTILVKKQAERALGTLGGGNHFMEIGVCANNKIWFIVHSGSRGPGHACATHYMRVAGNGKVREAHCPLRVDSIEGHNYSIDLNYMLEYALLNRTTIITSMVEAVNTVISGRAWDTTFINRNHNHAEFKDGLWIHRKGATHAEMGMEGVIPGNMRDGSFIVEGKGFAQSLCSSSHGAGRVYGRKAAKRELSLDMFKETMVGVKCNAVQDTLDESPMAYKDIFTVMEEQSNMVEVKYHIKPIINVKG